MTSSVVVVAMLSLFAFGLTAGGVLPPTLPPWPPTYNMSMSSLTMQCNSSGWSSPARGASFGIVSYDWSNAKDQWAMQTPMDCEARLLHQAELTKAVNPASKVFVYRNVVKALPWFASVRRILDDPAYAGFFLKFGPPETNASAPYHVPNCAVENSSKCSQFYHDQEQTPEVPTPSSPHPDGSCAATGCDCGVEPCGEYLFDHRNGSQLRDWIVNELILSPTALGSPAVDGMFIDDYWCSDLLCNQNPSIAGCPCGDPVQGPTEINKYSQQDMSLTDKDIMELTLGWNTTMGAVQHAILDHKGYTWTLMSGQQNANASPIMITRQNCAMMLRHVCGDGAHEWMTQAKLVGVTPNGTQLPQLQQDVAFFLLARGPFAWLGWGTWGMTWPFNSEPAHGELPPLPHGVPRPALMDRDFGQPLAQCREEQSGVFRRGWSKGDIRLDCNTFEATLG